MRDRFRSVAYTAYFALNGPLRKPDPEIQPINLDSMLAINKYLDANKDGHVTAKELDPSPDRTRCEFVDDWTAIFQGTPWFMNMVFTLLDREGNEKKTGDWMYWMVSEADTDFNGKTSIEEMVAWDNALFRTATLYSGFEPEMNLDNCAELKDVPEDHDARRIGMEWNRNQDGILSTQEIIEVGLTDVDNNRDGFLDLDEWMDKMINRYDLNPELLFVAFTLLDVNGDNAFDFRTEFNVFLYDFNLDGTITTCESTKGWYNLLNTAEGLLKRKVFE